MTFEEITQDLYSKLAVPILQRWLERGDGIALYENVELGHPGCGHKQWCSFGSSSAQIETAVAPERMPDIGGYINWRYMLQGTCKGEVDASNQEHRATVEPVDGEIHDPMDPEHGGSES